MKNWSGNLTYGVPSVEKVGSVEEIQALVRKYERLKILGTRHCFNHIADSKDRLLSLSSLDKILSLDTERQTVTVEGGVRYGDLAVWLHERGYALHNLASLPHISIAGGSVTATHGSGMKNGTLSTAVRAIEFVTASGDLATLSLEKDGELFCGAVVNLGGLGVLVRIRLAIEPDFQVRQVVYEDLSFQSLEKHFDEIMGSGYSVSLFTDWRNRRFNEVWIKSRIDAAGKVEAGFGARAAGPDAIAARFGARPATQNLHPIKDVPAENCTEQMGVPGPWHERLPHFRMGFTPSSGKELQSEYFVPADKSFEAIMAVEELHEKISPHLLISEIRSIAADELWMSPCYRQPCTAIHFTWQPDWRAVSKLLPLIEEQLAPFHARPHWGKLFTPSYPQIQARYPMLTEFQKLLRHYDPKGKFSNEFLDLLIFNGL